MKSAVKPEDGERTSSQMNVLAKTSTLPTMPLPREESMADELKKKEFVQHLDTMTPDEVTRKLEETLLERIEQGDSEAHFQLGQLQFEQGLFKESRKNFERAVEKFEDYQAMFQLGVQFYDGLGCDGSKQDQIHDSFETWGRTNRGIPHVVKGFELMKRVAESQSPVAKHLYFPAAYNLGKAYFQGYGTIQSDYEARKWWEKSADDGNPNACVLGQTTLGYMYCSEDHTDFQKARFWHSEACGNGSLESQGALGVMYLYGLGVEKDLNSAYVCLKEASDRGNVYAQGNLCYYYFKRKMFTKAAELAAKITEIKNCDEIARDTDCLIAFITKGISLASFVFARCLHKGLGVKRDLTEAKRYYSKSYYFDPDVCAKLQNASNRGEL